jgi:hypothetical protein
VLSFQIIIDQLKGDGLVLLLRVPEIPRQALRPMNAMSTAVFGIFPKYLQANTWLGHFNKLLPSLSHVSIHHSQSFPEAVKLVQLKQRS